MGKLKDFITALAKKAGYDTTSDAAKPFFDALPETEVPEDIQRGIDNSLISLSEARNNHPDLKNHYTKQSLDGVDKELQGLIDAFELDEANKTEILSEKSTYKRVPMLARRLVELERKKAAATGGKDKQEIQQQINDLQAQLKTTKEQLEAEKKNFETQRLQDKINSKKTILFSGLKTVHDELDPETKYTILDSQINKALQDNGVKFVLDDSGNFVLLRNDGTNYFGENHQQIKPAQFIEQILAKNKQLKVTDSSTGPNGTKSTVTQPASTTANGKTEQSQSTVIDRNRQALQDYENSMKTGAFGG